MASVRTKRGFLYLDFRHRGIRCRVALKLPDTATNKAEARRLARIVEGEQAAGTFDYCARFPDGPQAKLFAPVTADTPPLFADYAREWLRSRAGRLEAGTAYDEQRMLEARILPTLGSRRVDTLTVDDVEDLVSALRRGEVPGLPVTDEQPRRRRPRAPVKLSNRRVNMIHKLLRLALDRAVRKGWLTTNPARAVDLLTEARTHVDPLSRAEVRAFLERGGLDDEDRRYFTVSFFTGMRPSELHGLERETAIDWTHRKVCIRTTVGRFGEGKGKTADAPRDVAMLPVVERTLRAQLKAVGLRSTYVFPNQVGGPRNVGNMRRVWRRALKKAGLRLRPMYQARHTFATMMLDLGETPGWTATQLGHSLETFFRRYARFIPNHGRQDGAVASRRLQEEGW